MNGYLTVSFFCFGVLIVLTYAWQRFNEPSFPNDRRCRVRLSHCDTCS